MSQANVPPEDGASTPPAGGDPQSLPPKEIRHDDGRIEHPRVRRETRDVYAGWLIGLVVAGAVLFAAIFWGVKQFLNRTARVRGHVANQTTTFPLPRPPRLEPIDQFAHLTASQAAFRLAQKEARLNAYGRTQDERYVHIPIAEAIQLTAKKLASSHPPRAPHSQGLWGAGEPNSGRVFQEPPYGHSKK